LLKYNIDALKNIRIIARIDVKNEFVIKGIHLEGLRKIGDPNEIAKKYYQQGIDEIIFMDAVASLYERNNLFHIIHKACKEVFIPITIGGGIRSVKDIEISLQSGADKIAVNTGAIKNPAFIKEATRIYGSQCIVGSIEAKRKGSKWEAYIDNGREETGLDVIEWAKQLQDLGVGEILLTSVDNEGTKKGFDLDLIQQVSPFVEVPLIISGGAGKIAHFDECAAIMGVDAIAVASILHYNTFSVSEIKSSMLKSGTPVRI
jgi:cyclase